MAFTLKDRVKETSTTTGTGNISLGGAAATFDTFQSFLSNGDTTFYAIVHTSSGVDEWEVGLATWNTGNTLSRTSVLAGSNGTSAVNFSAGTKDVFMTYPASKAIVSGENAAFANITVTGTVDGRDIAADGTKLDGVEASADVTDTANVTAAGALMRSGGTMTGNLVLNANPSAALGAATKQYVDSEVSSLVDSAPSTLDTLNELAAALGDDANFSTTVTNSIATKLPLAGGTMTGAITVATTGVAASPSLAIDVSSSSAFVHSQENLAANLASTQTNILVIGKEGSTKNSGYLGFNWSSAGSNSNYVSLGHWGNNNLFRVYGDGTLKAGASNIIFHDGYHPNADAWTTARTLTLSGDASGSVSWDGSANATLSVSVGDADTVDGIHASSIFYDKGTTQIGSSSSWDVTAPGMYGVGSGSTFTGTNNPSSAISGIYTYGVLNVFEANGNGIAQLYTPHTGNKIAIRTGWNNGSWYPWQQVWTSTSDGSGSGLDADLLDGVHASGFVRGDGTNQSTVDIRADNTDFVVRDNGDSVTNFIWRDHSANTLYLGTANAVITARSTINANSNSITNVNNITGTSTDIQELNVNGGTRNNTNDATVYITATSNNDWGLVVNKYNSSASEYGVDIRMGSSFSYGFRVLGAGSTVSGISSGQLFHNSSVRGPIFYDSNDTAYYTDPASTSVVNQVIATNIEFGDTAGPILSQERDQNLKLQGSAGNDVGISGYSSNGTWSLQLYGHQNGQQGFLKSNWGSWSAYADTSGNWFGTASVRAPIFYDSDNTAYYVNPASRSVMGSIDFNEIVAETSQGGRVGRNHAYNTLELQGYGGELMIGSQSTAMSINYRTCNNGTSNHTPSTWYWRAGTSTNWSAHNFGAVTSNGILTATSDARAPIFYDSGNTAYFTSPAGYSKVNALLVGNQTTHTSNTTYGLQVHHNNRYLASFRYSAVGGNYPWIVHDSYNSTGAFIIHFNGIGDKFQFTQAGDGFAASSLRAPVFYDTDNTGYYVNPASTGTALNVNGTIAINNGGSSNTHGLKFTGSNSRIWFHGYRTIEGSTDGNNLQVGEGFNYTTILNQTRSPIFYDSDNTGYYANPAATSNIYSLTTASTVVIGGNFTNNAYSSVSSTRLLFGGGNDPNNYFLGTNLENYGGNYTKLDLRWHTGIRMGAQAQYGGVRIFDSEDVGTRLFSVGEGDTNVRVSNTLYAGNYYDINNTAYYVNPAESTRLYRLYVGGTIDDTPNGTQFSNVLGAVTVGGQSGRACYFDGGGVGASVWWGNGNTPYGAIDSDQSNGLRFYYNNSSGSWSEQFRVSDGYAIAINQMRAPIFYDSNNTSYYVNPNSDSRISRLLVGDGSNYIRIGDEGEGANTSYSRIRTNSSGDLFLDAKGSQNIYLGWWSSAGSRVYSEMGAQFPVYYDRNNTAYYADLAVTSVFNQINVTTLNSTSDIRFKSDLQKIENAVDKLKTISGYTYMLKDHDDRKAGLIAQEVEDVLPEAVKGDESKKLLDYQATIALLVEAVKEQSEEIAILKSRLTKLEN